MKSGMRKTNERRDGGKYLSTERQHIPRENDKA